MWAAEEAVNPGFEAQKGVSTPVCTPANVLFMYDNIQSIPFVVYDVNSFFNCIDRGMLSWLQ